MPDAPLQRTLLTSEIIEKSHVFQDQSTTHHSFQFIHKTHAIRDSEYHLASTPHSICITFPGHRDS
jgi:hypothetical protein